MRQSRNINIIVDAGGNRLVLINDILFKGKVEETKKEKHDKDAKHGWYRYDKVEYEGLKRKKLISCLSLFSYCSPQIRSLDSEK